MSTDRPTEAPPPPPPDRPGSSGDPINEPIAEQAMQKWDDGMDKLNAENLIALRNQQDILRSQGNDEGAAELEKQVARIPLSDDIKADPQAYLDRTAGPRNGSPPPPSDTAPPTSSPSPNHDSALTPPPERPALTDDAAGRAFTVRTPYPRPTGEAPAGAVPYQDLGRASELVPASERVDNPHPLPMGYVDHGPHIPTDPADKPPASLDPATAARDDQGYYPYVRKDLDWHNGPPLNAGDYLVQTATRDENGDLVLRSSSYFTDLDALSRSAGDAWSYGTAEQVGARNGQYPEAVVVYRVTGRIDGVARATATENDQFGPGGGTQYYLRGTDNTAVNPNNSGDLLEPVTYSEVKDRLGFEADIPDDATFIPLTHTSSPMNTDRRRPPI